MTAPDPRFRELLAKPIDHDAAFCCGPGEEFVRNAHEALYAHEYRAATHHGILDALLPAVRAYGDAIAAEVEARVQAAANQRAAEEPNAGMHYLERLASTTDNPVLLRAVEDVRTEMLRVRRAAALASPAPAPRAEEES